MCNAVTMVQSEQCQEEDTWGPFIYYVRTFRGGQILLIFSTKTNLTGGGGGGGGRGIDKI